MLLNVDGDTWDDTISHAALCMELASIQSASFAACMANDYCEGTELVDLPEPMMCMNESASGV